MSINIFRTLDMSARVHLNRLQIWTCSTLSSNALVGASLRLAAQSLYKRSGTDLRLNMTNAPDPLEGAPLIAPSSTDHPFYDQVVDACRSVYDPEIPVNIYELGLIYTIDISDENAVQIKMSLTAPGCPVAGEMPGWVADAIEPIPGIKQVDVELVWEPPWGMDMMSDEARLELGFM